MQIEKLRATVSELEQQLRELKSVDDESRQVLEDAVREIRATLHEEDRTRTQQGSLAQRLSDLVQKLEGEHPTLTGIIGRIADGLGQMGI